MTKTSSAQVRLDAFQNDNWSSSDVPVAILNAESNLHDRIAYCWGLVKHLHVLSDLLAEHENSEIQNVAALFGSQLIPLEAILNNMGSETSLTKGCDTSDQKS